jgi:hypothetical protein
MIPAYDDPIVWEGHSSIILEASRQMIHKPSAIFCSVGGAGLLGGIITGDLLRVFPFRLNDLLQFKAVLKLDGIQCPSSLSRPLVPTASIIPWHSTGRATL